MSLFKKSVCYHYKNLSLSKKDAAKFGPILESFEMLHPNFQDVQITIVQRMSRDFKENPDTEAEYFEQLRVRRYDSSGKMNMGAIDGVAMEVASHGHRRGEDSFGPIIEWDRLNVTISEHGVHHVGNNRRAGR